MIPGFPPSFAHLRNLYEGFRPLFEFRRQSFEEFIGDLLRQAPAVDIERELQTDSEAAMEIKTHLKQRHFYRSATCFYRSFDLFLAYVALQGQMFGTWSEVTGYYSRFYFIQALLNLLQANWFEPAGDGRILVYNTGTQVSFLGDRATRLAVGARRGSHQIWWSIFTCLGQLDGYPRFDTLQFVLSDGYFNPQRRNQVNYSHEYVTGFPELEWFDSATESMMAQFRCQHQRGDRDITDIDRFFAGQDPETCDVGDFYGDEAQMLWCSIDCYVRLLRALGIAQNFITVEKLDALARAHLERDLPRLLDGIRMSLTEALRD